MNSIKTIKTIKTINKQNIDKKLSTESIIISHLIITSILIFQIILPLLNSFNIKDNGLDLLNENYNMNFYKTMIVSFFINYVYLKIADLIPGNIHINFKRIVVILICSVLLNYYISNTNYESGTIKFMKEWTKNIGLFGILWDLFNTISVGYLANKINYYDIHKLNIKNVIIFFILAILFIHI